MLKTARDEVILPYWRQLIDGIKISPFSIAISRCCPTHGQPATPSTIGKEMANVAYRMERQYRQLNQVEILGKINGAVGNYNAHIAAYPKLTGISSAKSSSPRWVFSGTVHHPDRTARLHCRTV